MERRRYIKFFIKACALFFSVGSALYLFRIFQSEGFFTISAITPHFTEGITGYFLFIFLTAVCSAAGMPRQLLATLAGYTFGLTSGLFLVSIGLTLGCAIGFFCARFLGHSFIQQRLGKRSKKLESFLIIRPFLTTVAVRFLPIGNNAVTNFLGGVSAIAALPFIAGSCFGYLPQSLIFTLLGSGVAVDGAAQLRLSFILLTVSCVMGALLYKHIRQKQPDIGILKKNAETLPK